MPVSSAQVALGCALGPAGYAAVQGLLVVTGATLFLGVSWPGRSSSSPSSSSSGWWRGLERAGRLRAAVLVGV